MQRDIFKLNIARSLRVIRRRLVKYEVHKTDFLFFFGIPKLLYCMLHQLFSSALSTEFIRGYKQYIRNTEQNIFTNCKTNLNRMKR